MFRDTANPGGTRATAAASAAKVTFATFDTVPPEPSPAVEHISLGPEGESFARSVDPSDVSKNAPGDYADNILSTDHASSPVMGRDPGEDDDDQAFQEASSHSRSVIRQASTTFAALTPSAFNSPIATAANRYLQAANTSSTSTVRLLSVADPLAQSYMSEASEQNRIVSNLTNFYSIRRSPPAFGLRRFAIDRRFDSETRTWTIPATLHFRSEHIRTPASPPSVMAPTSSSPTAPVVNADTGSIPDDVDMEEAVPDEVERDEAAVPEQDEAPSVGQVELSPDTPTIHSEDIGGA